MGTSMPIDAATQRQRDLRDFRAFLREHLYSPQGRLARAGDLEDRDLDAMLRGALPPVWRWIFRHVRSEPALELVKRNVHLAQQQQESAKLERDAARERRDALESRRAYLLEAVARARAREASQLRSLRALELEAARATADLADRKQRQVLQRAARGAQSDAAEQLGETLAELRARVAVPRRSLAAPPGDSESGNDRNPVAVLLREFLRMLKEGDAEVVDFGDADVAHLRGFGGGALVRWLSELAAAGSGDLRLADEQDDAEYAAHVAANAGSSRDALAQIQQLLQTAQKEHIAKFLETQALYAGAQRARASVQRLQPQQQLTGADFDLWDGASDESKRAVADVVRLERESSAQRAALSVAAQTHAALAEQIRAARSLKADLDQKLELLQSFEQRQHEVLGQLDAMHQQNRAAAGSLVDQQVQTQRFVAGKLQAKQRSGERGAAIDEWRKLQADELRAFSRTPLSDLDTAVRSVELALDDFRGRGGDSGTKRAVRMAVPFSAFYTNRIQRETDGSSDGNSNSASAVTITSPTTQSSVSGDDLVRVLRALQVPEFGGWAKVVSLLQQQSNQDDAERTLLDQLELLRLQLPADGRTPQSQSQTLLDELQCATDTLQATALPQVEEAIATNTDTLEGVVSRLRTAVDDWYEQSGWSVQLRSQEQHQWECDELLGSTAPLSSA